MQYSFFAYKKVNINTYEYVYVMWQYKSEQLMDENDLGHIVFVS